MLIAAVDQFHILHAALPLRGQRREMCIRDRRWGMSACVLALVAVAAAPALRLLRSRAAR